MKNDRYLRGLYARPAPRRSTSELRTPLLIAAGLLGVPLAISLASHAFADYDDEVAPSAPPTVDAATAYPMNHFLPGAGYYHAPYHAWFPMPFNYYVAGRGWFRGGQWRRAADADDNERREEQRVSGFTSSGSSRAGRIYTSRPSLEAVQRANTGAATAHHANVIRGGFGSSSRPGIS